MGKKPNHSGNSHQRASNKPSTKPPSKKFDMHKTCAVLSSLFLTLWSVFDIFNEGGIQVVFALAATAFFTAAAVKGWLSHFCIYPVIGLTITRALYRKNTYGFIRSARGKFSAYVLIFIAATFGPYVAYHEYHPAIPEKGPIQLYSFSSMEWATLGNTSNHAVFVQSITAIVEKPNGRQSRIWAVGLMIPAHKKVKVFPLERNGKYSTLKDYASADWGEAWIAANDAYGRCLYTYFVDPNASKLKSTLATYRGRPLPIGNATAKITYLTDAGMSSEQFPLKALIMKKVGCTP